MVEDLRMVFSRGNRRQIADCFPDSDKWRLLSGPVRFWWKFDRTMPADEQQ